MDGPRSEPGARDGARGATPADIAYGAQPGAAALFGLSAVVLGLELFQVRLAAYSVQVILVYAVIGIALLGFGAAGTLVAVRREWRTPERLPRALALCALAFPLATVVSHALFVRLTPRLHAIDGLLFLAAGLLALPFLAAGCVLTLVLSTAGAQTGRAYAANLLGSAAGCFLTLLTLGPLDGERFLGALALLAFASALPYVRNARSDRVVQGVTVVAFAVAVTGLARAHDVFPIAPEPEPGGQLAGQYRYAAAHGIHVREMFDRWNPTGRIQVVQFEHVPGGPDPYHALFYAQDSTAGSSLFRWDGRTRSQVYPTQTDAGTFVSRMCTETMYGQGYYTPRSRVLIIGLGGGPDVQCALYQEARQVDVVEINRDSIAAIRGPFNDWLGGVGQSSRVHYYERDGRSFVHASGQPYDLIQLSGVDTKNNMASGALALSENHLYTREAFDDYFARLSPNGAVSIIRFGEPEALRLALTAMQALQARGIAKPQRHVAIFRVGIAYGVVARLSPWTATEARTLDHQLHPTPFRGISVYYYSQNGVPLEQPSTLEYLPFVAETGRVGQFFLESLAGRTRAFMQLYPFDIAATTDDRPFFFDVWRYDLPATWHAPHVRVLRDLLGSLTALCVLLILVPLRSLRVHSSVRGLRVIGPALIFGAIGFGFLLIEVFLMHVFSMFLGHQSYSLSVVLATLLVATGMGAAWVGRRQRDPLRGVVIAAGCVLVWMLVAMFVLPTLLQAVWETGLSVRIVVAVACVLPLGFPLGLPFVAALAFVRERDAERAPWCIGINGFTSIIASVTVVPLSMALGYRGVLCVAAASYVLAALCALALRRAPAGGR